MTEILLLILATIGFFTWHPLWMKATLDAKRSTFARIFFAVVGVASVAITVIVGAPFVTNSMPGMEGLVWLVYVVFPLMIVYAVAGLFGLFKLWQSRAWFAAQFKRNDGNGSGPSS